MDVTPILAAVVALAVAVITALLLPYIKAKTTAAQQQELCSWVAIAVAAAEQLYCGQGRGEEKKAFVLDWLQKRGLTADLEALDALIESAVYKLKEAL